MAKKVTENENENKKIIAKLQGVQTEYLFNNMIDGTNLVIPAAIILQKDFESNTSNVNIRYINEVGNTIERGSKEIPVNLRSEIKQSTIENENVEKLGNNEGLSFAAAALRVEELKQNKGLTVSTVAKVGETIVASAGTDETENIQKRTNTSKRKHKFLDSPCVPRFRCS